MFSAPRAAFAWFSEENTGAATRRTDVALTRSDEARRCRYPYVFTPVG